MCTREKGTCNIAKSKSDACKYNIPLRRAACEVQCLGYERVSHARTSSHGGRSRSKKGS